MKIKDLTCIGCPFGCMVHVEMENSDTMIITGNRCKKGENYVKKEVTHPVRTVTGSVHIQEGTLAMVSVKTVPEVPKESIYSVMEAIHQLRLRAPVAIGDILLTDIAGTGSDLVATKSVPHL